ncbi:MAG: hypothetical protein MUO90_03755, partial [Dehalococcoidales bacterium]|nr:hypothetical protein [Dehalococcoidales bacterium]
RGDHRVLKGTHHPTLAPDIDRGLLSRHEFHLHLGFSDSRAQARQIVQHGHILLNGHKTDIPSCLVKEGDIISWHERSTKKEYYKQLTQVVGGKVIPSWLSLDKQELVGRVLSLPTPDDIVTKFDVAAVVEYYSR